MQTVGDLEQNNNLMKGGNGNCIPHKRSHDIINKNLALQFSHSLTTYCIHVQKRFSVHFGTRERENGNSPDSNSCSNDTVYLID